MKRSKLLIGFLVCISFGLKAQDSIVVEFLSDSPLDSIAIENLTSGDYRVLVDVGSIVYCFPPGETVSVPSYTGVEKDLIDGPLIYPNPFQGSTVVEFFSSLSSRISMSIFDLAGNLVTGLDLESGRGIQRFSVQLDSPGLYLLHISDSRKECTGVLVNMGSAHYATSIAYTGQGDLLSSPRETNPKAANSTLKWSSFDGVTDSTSTKGDLLRLTGYSSSDVDVIFDRLLADTAYVFHFSGVAPGVYLQLHDTLPYAPDTIRCFATASGYHFTFDAGGDTIFSRDSVMLQPVTHGGIFRPVYGWDIENPSGWHIDTSLFSTGILHPAGFSKDTSRILLQDLANNYSTEFVLIMVPDDFAGPGIVIGEIQNDNTLDEISGMAASVKNPGAFWVHNDSGDEARIFLIDTEGYIISTVNIDTDFTDNRDWEDICVGPGPVEGESYIYIAEIGDLDREYDNKYIFRITEPVISLESKGQKMNIPRDSVSTITFDYKYGPRDAEILMIDPLTRDLYIVTKREEKVQVFPIPYPQNFDEKMILTKSSVFLPFRLANGGDISADGKEILIKNLDTVYYWKLQEGETILDALAREGQQLPYIREPQGEAIAWMRDGSGYLTVSEARDNITPRIYLYQRQW